MLGITNPILETWNLLYRLQKLQCIRRVQKHKSLIVLPLSVVFSNKLWLVMDASRHIDPYVKKRKVKLYSLDNFAFLVQERNHLHWWSMNSGKKLLWMSLLEDVHQRYPSQGWLACQWVQGSGTCSIGRVEKQEILINSNVQADSTVRNIYKNFLLNR